MEEQERYFWGCGVVGLWGCGVGVGPREVADIWSNSVEMTPWNEPIMHFSRAKKLLFARFYSKSEVALRAHHEGPLGAERDDKVPKKHLLLER